MGTTTIRIDDELKARVAAAAEHSGKTTHAFILGAIANTVARAELARDFGADADPRWADNLEGGKTIEWDEMRRYIVAKTAGEKPAPPKARTKRR